VQLEDKQGLVLAGHPFEGPFGDIEQMDDFEGVWVALVPNGSDWDVVDVGQAPVVRTWLERSRDRWPQDVGSIVFGAFFSNRREERAQVELDILVTYELKGGRRT
jgi:hypothetical protein